MLYIFDKYSDAGLKDSEKAIIEDAKKACSNQVFSNNNSINSNIWIILKENNHYIGYMTVYGNIITGFRITTLFFANNIGENQKEKYIVECLKKLESFICKSAFNNDFEYGNNRRTRIWLNMSYPNETSLYIKKILNKNFVNTEKWIEIEGGEGGQPPNEISFIKHVTLPKKRTLTKNIKQISNSFPVLLLTGARQVGKSTLLELCADEGRNYVTLDNLENRSLAKTDPAGFLEKYKTPITIDEIQYAPELFSYIKIAVDKTKNAGNFWLTGSQKFLLMKGIRESLAGRVAIIDLLGFSQAENSGRANAVQPFLPTKEWLNNTRNNIQTTKPLMSLYKDIWRGSYPKVTNEDRDSFYDSYVQTYIQRDIKDILNITDDLSFYRFLCVIAARTGQMLNYADIARDADIDHKTLKSWISVLETSGIIYILQPYFSNITKRLVKSPKIYFLDTGLCSYLTRWTTPESLEAGAMSGAILETYIFSEILKTYLHNGKKPHLYYYRDSDQKEVDLLIDQDNTLYPIEFKKTSTPSLTASKHFSTLGKLAEKEGKKLGHGAVICLVDKDVPLSQEVDAIPVSYI